MEFFRGAHYDFLGKTKFYAVFSGLLLLAGIVSLIAHGGPELSVDFTGGTLLQYRFSEEVKIQDIRSSVTRIGLANAEIQRFGEDNEVLVRVPQTVSDEDLGLRVLEALRQDMPNHAPELRREEAVGPRVGEELRSAAILAVISALALILVYIAWRFQFRFGVAAIIALIHDVTITVGIFSLLGKEISLAIVAALLAIVGYSLNDTIVVFDRIREDLRVLHRERFPAIVNASINETLSRTVITSGTTLLTVLSLMLFGGSVIFDFAFALFVGVGIGTYSSICVASPILVWWHRKDESKSRAAATVAPSSERTREKARQKAGVA